MLRSERWACLRIAGIAMLPTADAPVKNLAALIQLRKKRGNCESLAHDNKQKHERGRSQTNQHNK
ncbi:hypothetical protein MUK42_28715 [Musa troglodytarum]|uniref:Uncharacterized protein n=1 Tax=Musa troglodytarum TaxID=320322 RepID=A0A9E7G6M6_9LILI|nr:hypothetical protein MUK42_28715 [Musa troglodytarum]